MNKSLKILFLTNCSPLPIRDGQSRRTYNILKGLADKHEVYLLSFYLTADEVDRSNISDLESFCKFVEMCRAPSKKLSFSMAFRLLRSLISASPYTIWRHHSHAYLKRMYELIKITKFDLIHCDALPIAYTIRKINNIPCIITDHDVSYLKTIRRAKYCSSIILRLFLYLEAYKVKNLERKVFEQVDRVITVSGLDKKHLKKLCPKGRFDVIENGVDIDMFKPNVDVTKSNVVLWVGGFGEYSNVEAMVYFLEKIYPLIKLKVDDISLNIVGKDLTQKLQKLISADSSIKSIGFVDDPIPYLQEASVFIAPILSGSGTRLKIIEAMAVGKAIVTTSIGCEGIAGVNREHYLIADSPDDFITDVIELLDNKNLRSYLGGNARELAEQRYDWKVIYEKMDEIYRSFI